MKKYLSLTLMAAIVAMTLPLLTACGSDDDNGEDTPNTDNKQRIELTISGNTEGWVIGTTFWGYTTDPLTPDQTCTLVCNQTDYVFKENNVIDIFSGGKIQRTYPVTVTHEGNSTLFLNMQITKNGEFDVKDVPDITITLKGYKGSRLTNSFSKTYKSTTIATIGFHADKSDDKVGAEGENATEIYRE